HLEDDAGGVWQDRHALERETPERPRPIPGGGVQPTSPGGVRYGGGAAQFHHRDRIAVPAPHDELLLRGGPPLRVGGALGHHRGEGPEGRAGGGAGAPLGAGPPAVAAPLTACRTCPLALGQLRRTGAVARCRGTSSRGGERQANGRHKEPCYTASQQLHATATPPPAATRRHGREVTTSCSRGTSGPP